jgi:hypothetical protein
MILAMLQRGGGEEIGRRALEHETDMEAALEWLASHDF